MNKSETREVSKLGLYLNHGMHDVVARSLSALIRASRTQASRNALMQQAFTWNVQSNPEFIV